MKTYPPELDPAALQRLSDYAALFAADFPQAKPARWSGVYLQGLLLDGERKSIEPMAGRVTLPADLHADDVEQALQQFVNQSPWDDQPVLRSLGDIDAKPIAERALPIRTKPSHAGFGFE